MSDDGRFTEEAGHFSGLDVLGDGNVAVVKYLDEQLSLLVEEPYSKLSSYVASEPLSSFSYQIL